MSQASFVTSAIYSSASKVFPIQTKGHLTNIKFYCSGAGQNHYKVLVLGGGSGGSSISNALGRKLGKENVAVVEPSEVHYYQPMWTLIGAGAKKFYQCQRPTSQILRNATWIKDRVSGFKPDSNQVAMNSGKKYEILHVAPPCTAPEPLRNCSELIDQMGYLNLDKGTLQHVLYKNVFGLGDCTNLPTSKTAAAAGVESGVLQKNVICFLENRNLPAIYDGYASCPLVTSYNTGIMPEFDYSMTPLETFPFDQSKERRVLYYMKADLMPFLYWNGLVKGIWKGPAIFRRLFRLGLSSTRKAV